MTIWGWYASVGRYSMLLRPGSSSTRDISTAHRLADACAISVPGVAYACAMLRQYRTCSGSQYRTSRSRRVGQ
eukprot:3615553-Rhodomonas_salina.1